MSTHTKYMNYLFSAFIYLLFYLSLAVQQITSKMLMAWNNMHYLTVSLGHVSRYYLASSSGSEPQLPKGSKCEEN